MNEEEIVHALNTNVRNAMVMMKNSSSRTFDEFEEDFNIIKKELLHNKRSIQNSGSHSTSQIPEKNDIGYLNHWKKKGYLFYDYLWNKVLDRREKIMNHQDRIAKQEYSPNTWAIPDEKFELHIDKKQSLNKDRPSLFTNQEGGSSDMMHSEHVDEPLVENRDILKKYGLSTRSSSRGRRNRGSSSDTMKHHAAALTLSQTHNFRSMYMPRNLNPVDFNNGDVELFNTLKNLLSHQSIQREELIRQELSLMLQEDDYFVEKIFERYTSLQNTMTLEQYVDTVMDMLYQQGLKRRNAQNTSIQLLQGHSLNEGLDIPSLPDNRLTHARKSLHQVIPNADANKHLAYQIQRQYEFSKQVASVFNNRADRKLFQDNPMGLPWLDPSTEMYHPFAFDQVVFEPMLKQSTARKELKKKDKTQPAFAQQKETIPLLPKRKRREKTGFMSNSLFSNMGFM
ncbi:hypothetical protein C9374_001070 [Naegleria lovaniensis]|uniref:Uncharacterized protein n=1 Tax=Naegleria lovaniensis TaxID=51637 RepID=A0AA88GSS6_NAELO|nr:uncharacterized protein C9374_001070 [Naegleria lovaniensis]KAG2388220.1 hypothetical protein C9374_001070 [Naegleria lovaniensis]